MGEGGCRQCVEVMATMGGFCEALNPGRIGQAPERSLDKLFGSF